MDLFTIFAIICQVESGCNPDAIGDDGRAIGIAQIHYECILDVNTRVINDPFKHEDAKSVKASWFIFNLYIRKYAGKEPITLEKAARIWNSGPSELPCEDYVRKCQMVDYRKAKDKVWRLIHESNTHNK